MATKSIQRSAPRPVPDFRRSLALLFLVAACTLGACGIRWSTTSRMPVAPLAQPALEFKLASLHPDASAGFSFTTYGDQRALADGEWQAMIVAIDSLARQDPRLSFMLDTGDIVNDGSHADQFHQLTSILGGAGSLPYLVGVGNHEVADCRPGPAREHTATFLAPLDSVIDSRRLYYEKTVGRVRFLFLDSNDLVYDDGPGLVRRREAQIKWLSAVLGHDPDRPGYPTVVVMHHPILQSSSRHRGQARALWSLDVGGRPLADVFADHGVDLVLTGHTHTYERIRATRADGRGFCLVNLSGRPRPDFLWFGAGARRARRIPAGGERDWFASHGWRNLDGWSFVQEAAMYDHEADQFAVMDVSPDGAITMRLRFMNRGAADPPVLLVAGAGGSASGAGARP